MSRRDPPLGSHLARRPLNAPPSQVAKGGAALGLVGLVVAILFWTGVIGKGETRVDPSSPSYVSGRQFGSTHFSLSTSQGAVCNTADAATTSDLTEWMQGCHDAWAIANFSSGVRSGGGPIP